MQQNTMLLLFIIKCNSLLFYDTLNIINGSLFMLVIMLSCDTKNGCAFITYTTNWHRIIKRHSIGKLLNCDMNWAHEVMVINSYLKSNYCAWKFVELSLENLLNNFPIKVLSLKLSLRLLSVEIFLVSQLNAQFN